MKTARSVKLSSLHQACIKSSAHQHRNKMESKTFSVKTESGDQFEYDQHEDKLEIQMNVLKEEVHNYQQPECITGPATFPPIKEEFYHGAALLIDEVQTGGGPTGKMWCHEHFNLDSPPDIVTFSKKMQLGGYYMKFDLKVKEAHMVFNTCMGDPGKLVLLQGVLSVIKRDNLLSLVRKSGDRLFSGLKELEKEFLNLINSTRGRGTFLAVTCPNTKLRDSLVNSLKTKGIQTGGCGELSIRFRPALIFQPHHADIFLDSFRKVLSEIK